MINGSIGNPWYTREDYPAVRDVMADKEILPIGYDEWKKSADAIVQQAEAMFGLAVRVDLNADELLAWCRERKVGASTKTAGEMAADIAFRTRKDASSD